MSVEREVVDVALIVLMPGQIAYILHNPDHRRLQLVLNAKTVLRNRRSRIGEIQSGQAAGKERRALPRGPSGCWCVDLTY